MTNQYTQEILDHLYTLDGLSKDVQEAETKIKEVVKKARKCGASWSQIGVGLGVTTQAAWERYGPSKETRFKQVVLDTLEHFDDHGEGLFPR